MHHIGEALVASMLRELHGAGKLQAITLHRLAADLTCETKEPAFDLETIGGALRDLLRHDPSFLPEWHLFDETLTFDAESRVDVLIRSGSVAMPWEVKLGLTGLGRGSMLRGFCAGTLPNTSSKNRVAGNMISILQDWCAGRSEMASTPVLSASDRYQSGARVALERRWGLVLRRAVLAGLRTRGASNPKKRDQYGTLYAGVHIIVFEDLLDALGEERFWNLIRELFEESLASWKKSFDADAEA